MKRDMYNMNPFRQNGRSLWPLWLLALLLCAACTGQADDPTATDEGRTATLRLIVPQPEAATRTDPGDETYEKELATEESAIYTLRIVIYSLRNGNNATTINRLYTASELKKNNNVLTITGVPVGVAQICAIANEGSIGQDYSDILTMQQQAVNVEGISKVLITDDGNKYFPKRGTQLLAITESAQKGLPMSWMAKDYNIKTEAEGENSLSVELVRCVSKIRMEIQNNFSEKITVSKVSFGAFFGNSFYLFSETDLDVPAGQTYVGREFEEGVSYDIQPNGKEVLILYFYPSFAWTSGSVASPYTIGFVTEGGTYPQMAFLDPTGTSYNSIPRNTQVNISVTLSGETHVSVDFAVVGWEKTDITVPDFE